MTISFQLPGEVEESLRRDLVDVNQAVKEAALVELFRQHKLSHFELSKSLGISRLATDALLKRHNVTEDLLTVDELREELGPLKATEK